MARSLGTLTLDLIAKIGGFVSGMTQAERVAQDRTRKIQRSFSNLQRSVAGVLGALGGAALIRSIIRNTAEFESIQAQLQSTLRSTGEAAGYNAQQLNAMAAEIARASTFSTNEIAQAETRLLTYTGIVGENFPKALQTAVDYATRFNVSLVQASETIGKAMEQPLKGMASLQKQGFFLSDAQKKLVRDLQAAGRESEAQAIVLDMLSESTEGAARAARDTFGGALKSLRNNFSDLLTGRSGISDATEAINNLSDILSSDEIRSGFDTLISGLANASAFSAQAAAGLASFSHWVGQSLAAVVSGPASDDLVRMSDRIIELREKVKELENITPAGRVANPFLWAVPASKALETLRKELSDLEAQYKDAQDAAGRAATSMQKAANAVSGSGGRAGVEPPPSEEFLKLEARLKEQIALYGKVGEAAKFAYAIESGQLDDLSKKEQDRILSLARRFDSMVKAQELAKEQEKATQEITKAFDRQAASLQKQLTLTGEVTELERLRYEINSGGLQKLNADQRQHLEGLAQQVDLQKQRADMEDRVRRVTEDTLTPLEKYQRTIESLNELFAESRELLGEQGLGFENYKRAVEQAQKELEEATKNTNEFMLEAARGTQNVLADTLFGAMRGELKDVEQAFISMIQRLIAESLAAQIATKLFGDPGSGGGLIGSATDWFKGLFGGGRASGGPVSAGTLYRVNENGVEGLSIPGRDDYLLMGRQGGRVVPAGSGGSQSTTVSQTINVRGHVTTRTAKQIQVEAARRQQLATVRLGG